MLSLIFFTLMRLYAAKILSQKVLLIYNIIINYELIIEGHHRHLPEVLCICYVIFGKWLWSPYQIHKQSLLTELD